MEREDGGQQPRTSSFPPSPSSSPVVSCWEEEQVMSEVHLGCPPNHSGPHVSHFTISLPPHSDNSTSRRHTDAVEDISISTSTKFDLDEDGDLILTRRKRLVGILLSRVAKTVFITDHGDKILENCEKNVNLNAEIFHGKASVHVRELDWKDSWPPQEAKTSPSKGRYSWTQSEIEELKKSSLLLAADVIYSDDLTDAFFSILEKLMSDNPEKVLYLALEKRYNFVLDDLDVVANGYSHFHSYLITEEDDAGCKQLDSASEPFFVGEQIDLRCIPCCVKDYNRGNDVEIWKIKLNHRALF